MNKLPFDFPSLHRRSPARGQGLVEYALLLVFIAALSLAALVLMGGSVEGGYVKVCAALGGAGCQAVAQETVIAGTPTATPQVSATPSLIPTATLVPVDPDPTRPPVATIGVENPPPSELIEMKIKVVLKGKGGKLAGIRVVIYNAAGEYVGEGVTDSKGNLTLNVPIGTYTVATLYDDVWQNDGPFEVKNSKQNVIHR